MERGGGGERVRKKGEEMPNSWLLYAIETGIGSHVSHIRVQIVSKLRYKVYRGFTSTSLNIANSSPEIKQAENIHFLSNCNIYIYIDLQFFFQGKIFETKGIMGCC